MDKYEVCKKDATHESDKVLENHYNETLSAFGFEQFGEMLNSGASELKIENGHLVGQPTRMVPTGSLTLEQSHQDFSQLNAVNQVKMIKLCDRVAYGFELMAEYDGFANSEEVKDAAYRKFKTEIHSMVPAPSLTHRVVKRRRDTFCGESPDDESKRQRRM